jgi:hypothetical protein
MCTSRVEWVTCASYSERIGTMTNMETLEMMMTSTEKTFTRPPSTNPMLPRKKCLPFTAAIRPVAMRSNNSATAEVPSVRSARDLAPTSMFPQMMSEGWGATRTCRLVVRRKRSDCGRTVAHRPKKPVGLKSSTHLQAADSSVKVTNA